MKALVREELPMLSGIRWLSPRHLEMILCSYAPEQAGDAHFIILPALNAAFVTFVLQYHWSKGMSKIVFRGFMMFAVVVLPCALTGTCLWRADRIKAQLERQGYVQRWMAEVAKRKQE